MAKVPLLKQAADLNPFNTDSFLFVDAGHLCHAPEKITVARSQRTIAHFLEDGFVATATPYEAESEPHGFEQAAFDESLGIRASSRPTFVGRGGIF